MNRQEATQALAKIFAYLACGKTADARKWALPLIQWLQTL